MACPQGALKLVVRLISITPYLEVIYVFDFRVEFYPSNPNYRFLRSLGLGKDDKRWKNDEKKMKKPTGF